jgi:hypothetical protein
MLHLADEISKMEMKQIRILGLGNSRYRQLSKSLDMVMRELGWAVVIEEVMEVDQILSSGVESIPAIVFNGEVVFDGKSNPTRAELRAALLQSTRQVY